MFLIISEIYLFLFRTHVIINERIVILSFSFLCTKIRKRFHNPVHGHRLISNTVQISLLLVGRLPQKTIFVENKKEESYPMYLMYLTCLTVAYPLRNDEFCGCPRRQLLLCEQDALHLFDWKGQQVLFPHPFPSLWQKPNTLSMLRHYYDWTRQTSLNYEKDKLASRLVYQGMEMVVCEEKCQEKCPYTLVQEHLSS